MLLKYMTNNQKGNISIRVIPIARFQKGHSPALRNKLIPFIMMLNDIYGDLF